MKLTEENKEEIRGMIKEEMAKAVYGEKEADEHSLEAQVERWKKNAIEVAGYKVAPEDYYEIDEDGNKKTEFTFNEVEELGKKLAKIDPNIKVLSPYEASTIITTAGRDGDHIDISKAVKTLNLTTDEDEYGDYWSREVSSGASAYYFHFYSSNNNFYPQNNYYKYFGRSVRCLLRIMKEEK